MNKKQEEIRATVPARNAWHTRELEEKAKKHGLKKSEFILKAVDTFINFDDEFIEFIDDTAFNNHVAPYMVIQNMIINSLAREAAEDIVDGPRGRIRHEFTNVSDSNGYRMLTGEELKQHLTDLYVRGMKGAQK